MIVETLLDKIGTVLAQIDQLEWASAVAQLRSRLDDEIVMARWHAGQILSWEEVLAARAMPRE